MFEEMFKQQLYALFVLNPNRKLVQTQVSSWNEKTVWSWASNNQDFALYLKNLGSKQINRMLMDCKKSFSEYLESAKAEFQSEFPKSGIQILTEAHETQPTSVGERALDAVARLLLSKFPETGCVCVCVHPLFSCLVVACNTCVLYEAMVTQALKELAVLAKSEIEALREGHGSIEEEVAKVRPSWEARELRLGPGLWKARLRLDRLKYYQQLENLTALPVRVPQYPRVHADIQLLEYIETSLRRIAMRTVPMYLGDAMRCCAKCETLIREYNSCGMNKVRVNRRGYHSTYDFSNWTCPQVIRKVITHNGQRRNMDKAIQSLIFAEQSGKYSMHAELSDSEG